MFNPHHFWTVRSLPLLKAVSWRLGRLQLWLRRSPGQWSLAQEPADAGAGAESTLLPAEFVPEGLEWRHFPFAESPPEFELCPRVPDRPVIVRPYEALTVLPGQRATLFAQIPVWMDVHVIGQRERVCLTTLPSRRLADTWFGSPSEGELCYHLRLPAEHELGRLTAKPHHLVCPLAVHNRSPEPLCFDRLCLRLKPVGLYGGWEHLWTSPVGIDFTGPGREAHLRYEPRAPVFEDNLVPLSAPEPSGAASLPTFPEPSADFCLTS